MLPNSSPLRIFIGWDSREPIAFSVASHSILRRASIPVLIMPLTRLSVARIYTRQRGPTEATEFSLTRFLVPYLSDYRGISVFMDCDMLMRVDILDLWLELLAKPGKALWCCQHDYIPKALTKFDGHEQTKYQRKNWSSFMVFDNAQCQALTPEYVNTATGLQLHRFQWITDEQIGALPLEWNHLVGEDNQSTNPPKVIHFTNGGPWIDAYRTEPFSDLWELERREMLGHKVEVVA